MARQQRGGGTPADADLEWLAGNGGFRALVEAAEAKKPHMLDGLVGTGDHMLGLRGTEHR